MDYVQKLPYVNAGSLAVYGCSGGGDLAVAVASERRVAAIAGEEPASILFTGVFDKTSPKAGAKYTPQDSAPLFVNPDSTTRASGSVRRGQRSRRSSRPF